MKPIRLLNLGPIPPWQTQAVYHMLAERMTAEEPDAIIICRPSAPYLCLGYHQVFESIFDPTECERRGLPVFRRKLGGGATYLDQNQLFYQCIFHHTRMPAMLKDIYTLALAAPVKTLKRLGLNAELRETNEIEVDGKRVAGTGGGRIDEACIVVGNLLFDFDFEAMTSVWQTPSPAFRQLAQTALRQRIITLKELTPRISSWQGAQPARPGRRAREAVTDLLIRSFAESFARPLQPDALTNEELTAAQSIAEKLSSTEYLSLHKKETNEPMHSLKISARAFIHAGESRIDGYNVRGSFWVSQDVIQTAKLESEPRREWQPVEERLKGIPFKEWQEQIYVP
jgi:lipoate-protein ligase A